MANVLRQLSPWTEHLHDVGEWDLGFGNKIRLYNLFTSEVGNRNMPPGPRSMPVRDPSNMEPNTGRLVPKLCNRRTQEDEFKHFFISSFQTLPGIPQVYVSHGCEGECHESLVERFLHRVELFAQEKYGDGKGAVCLKRIPWQYEGSVDVRKIRLLSHLFEQCALVRDLKIQDIGPANFVAIVRHKLNSFLILQHDVRASRWDKFAPSLIESYLEFWSNVDTRGSGPQILIFLNVIYPLVQHSTWSARLGLSSGGRLQKRVEKELRGILGSNIGSSRKTLPTVLLSELRPVTRDDVMEWFSLHNIFDSEELRLRASLDMFTTGKRLSELKSMAEVELGLRDVHKRFVSNRGYV